MILSVSIGIALTWMPSIANSIAHSMGVGRGSDLIFYMWILVSLFALITLHFSISRQNKQITELARALAILSAENQEK
jgi:hypothetical protein